MGCQSEVYVGANLTWSMTTHEPDTGVLTDCDSAPLYRIYEDEAVTAILTGTMTKLDDVNTTGFYTELIACTGANGFEDGKSYTIYIEATVDSDTGGISFGFRAMTPVWDSGTRTLTASGSTVTVVAAIVGDVITFQRGDSFSASIAGLGNISARSKLWFTVKTNRDYVDSASLIQIEESAGLVYLNGADASLRASNGSITVTDAAAGDITIALDEAETDDLAAVTGLYYDIQVLTSGGAVSTLSSSSASVTADVTRVVT